MRRNEARAAMARNVTRRAPLVEVETAQDAPCSEASLAWSMSARSTHACTLGRRTSRSGLLAAKRAVLRVKSSRVGSGRVGLALSIVSARVAGSRPGERGGTRTHRM